MNDTGGVTQYDGAGFLVSTSNFAHTHPDGMLAKYQPRLSSAPTLLTVSFAYVHW